MQDLITWKYLHNIKQIVTEDSTANALYYNGTECVITWPN